jgi:hypothetical protein
MSSNVAGSTIFRTGLGLIRVLVPDRLVAKGTLYLMICHMSPVKLLHWLGRACLILFYMAPAAGLRIHFSIAADNPFMAAPAGNTSLNERAVVESACGVTGCQLLESVA